MIELKKIRKSCGYTQIELAKLIEISQQQYSRYERGKNKIPLETFLKILEICEGKWIIQIKNQQYILKNE